MSTFVERLPCKLSSDEIVAKGHQIVDCMRRKVQLEAEKADAVARIKLDIKACDQKVVELAQEYDTGIEYRDVLCEKEEDFEHACIRTFRRDTNELLHTRIMRAEERQAALDFEEGGEGEQLEGMRAAPEMGPGDERGPGDGEEDDDDVDDPGEPAGATAH